MRTDWTVGTVETGDSPPSTVQFSSRNAVIAHENLIWFLAERRPDAAFAIVAQPPQGLMMLIIVVKYD